ncbi:hypothetical protein A4A49_03333 [Nicotiana attenuata]|uniref:Uncharacterized protein n=1 Tax=Nicotiana attenuata TaxID=49451 RepID=A0A1J6I6Y1_NICAT|nr:hypothetical protein A4A49_03333 [Nicotiana attenuata]
MGDLETLAKARRELEDLYLGVRDDSVNLTFEDLSEVRPHNKQQQHNNATLSSSSDKKINSQKEVMMSDVSEPLPNSSLTKLPSLDFNRAFENIVIENNYHTNNHVYQDYRRPQNHGHHVMEENSMLHGRHSDHHHNLHHGYGGHGSGYHHREMDGHYHGHGAAHHNAMNGHHHGHGGHHHAMDGHGAAHHHGHVVGGHHPYGSHGRMHVVGNSMSYDHDMSQMSGISMVCGRAYCRQCVRMGMGEMAEGRKCVECLGKRFSQRYLPTS